MIDVFGLMKECGVGGFEKGTRNNGIGFGDVVFRKGNYRFVSDEIRAKEIKRERDPKNTFVIFETEVVFPVLRMMSTMFV